MRAHTSQPSSTSYATYEDNLLELLQAVSPGKKLKKEDIPWDNVRAYLIEEIIRRSTKPNQRVRYVPRPIEGVPHAELSLYRLERPKHGLDAKESAFFKNLKVSMLPKEERKLVKLRQKRRALHQSSSYFRLDCEERDLPSAFSRNYEALIIHRKHPSQCLRIILNSLSEYFCRKTWSTNVNRTVSDYLRQCVLKSGSDLCQPSDRQIPLAYLQLETELACLIEIYLLEAFPKASVHETDIFTKLNLLHHIFDGETLKKALNETLCDEFAHIHGQALTEIYEWFNLPIPDDLLKYESQAHKISTDWGFEESLKKKEEDGKDEDTVEANGNSLSQTPSAPVTRRTSRSSGSSDDAEVVIPEKTTRKGRTSKDRSEIVFTCLLEEEEPLDDEKVTVPPQRTKSPPKNARCASSLDSKPALRVSMAPSTSKSYEKPKLRRRSPRRSTVRSGPVSQISKTRKRKLRVSTQVMCRRKSPRTSSVHVKHGLSIGPPNKSHALFKLRLRKRPSLAASLPSLRFTPVKASLTAVQATPRKPHDGQHVTKPQLLPRTSTTAAKNAASVLENAVLTEYRRRMEDINRTMSRREQEQHEVFYGRGSVRRNLFEKQEDSALLELPKPSAAQKSRSGRAVKQMEDDSCLHIAHTLLNVQNTSPHLPYKLVVNGDTPVPFRVKKLLRRVTRAQQKRIVKFRQNAKLLHKSNNVAVAEEITSQGTSEEDSVGREEVEEAPTVACDTV